MNLLRRVDEMKIATNEWKSNLTNLSVGESGLTIESSNQLRERVTKVSQEVKKLQNDMKAFVNQVYKLQDISKNFEREMKSLQLSVEDASRVGFLRWIVYFVRMMSVWFRKHEISLPKSIKRNFKHNKPSKNPRQSNVKYEKSKKIFVVNSVEFSPERKISLFFSL